MSKDLGKAGASYARSARDREARLRAAKDVLQGVYSYLSKVSDKVSDSGPEVTKLAAFLVDYSYEASRWSLARQQIGTIIDGLDRLALGFLVWPYRGSKIAHRARCIP